MTITRWLLVASVATALSCLGGDAPPAETEVYVKVDTNIPGGPQSVLRGVRVYASTPEEAPTSALSQDFQVPDGRGERNLFYVRVVPLRGDATRRVRFTVYGCSTVSCDPLSDAGVPVTANSVTFGYLPQRTGWVRVFLADECRDVTCDETRETCDRDARRCRPIPDVPPGSGRLDQDAGNADGDVADATAADVTGDAPIDRSSMDAGDAPDATIDGGTFDRLDAGPAAEAAVDGAPDLPRPDGGGDAACPAGRNACGGACVDVGTSIAHCGRCGNACPTGANASPVCASGACGLGCNAGYGDCDRVTANGCEANLGADARNCGACGMPCAAGLVCSRGACVSSCGSGTSNCGGACVNTQTDPLHCGRCGAACMLPNVVTHTCAGGACGIGACATGFANCDGLTANGCEVNVRGADLSNCGGCGIRCAFPNASATCATGACGMGACAPGFGNCDSAPANGCEITLPTDARHCGMCGRACPAINNTPACVGGACQVGTCTGTWRDCDGNAANGCEINSASDVNHCGGCGRRCMPPPNMTATCVAAACTYTCAAGFASCDLNAANGCEVNVAGDVRNCGRCGNVCPVPAGGSATCVAGTCGQACPAGTTLCGGACVNVATSLQHCGGCGRTCAPPRAVPVCVGGMCRVSSCQTGWRDCDGNAANGCEVDVTTGVNCGACGRSCPTGQSCVAGSCQVSCPSPNQVCDGACVDVASDVNHCGFCGNGCGAPAGGWSMCVGSGCSSGCFAGATDCGGICRATGASCSSGGSGGCQQGGSVVCLGTGTTCNAAPRTSGACMVPAGGVCSASGDCVCPAGQTNCSGVCQSLNNDLNNCGACGNVCAARANASVTCGGGSCNHACSAGFGDCDGNPANGCETSTASNASHCGMCGRVCGAPIGGSAICAGGICTGSCPAGSENCEGVCIVRCVFPAVCRCNACLTPMEKCP